MNRNSPSGIVVVAALMIIFGVAEVTTGFTHHFFGLSTSSRALATWAAVAIGAFYAAAGMLLLSMRKLAAALALALLAAVVAGRILMVMTGLYPMSSFRQVFAIALGTAMVVVFAAYVRLQWSGFR